MFVYPYLMFILLHFAFVYDSFSLCLKWDKILDTLFPSSQYKAHWTEEKSKKSEVRG